MRIGIDVRCLSDGRRTGVEEYTLNLLSNLFEMDRRNEYVLFFNSYRKTGADFSWIGKYPNVTLKKFNYPNKLLNFLFWYFNWPKIDKMIGGPASTRGGDRSSTRGGVDIVFMPNIIFGSVSKDSKLVVTLHDLSFERYPETFSWKRRLWHLFVNPKSICRKADRIIAVSESTKNDIANLYGIDSNKIRMIHSGLSEKFAPVDRNNAKLIQTKEKYDLPYKFILYLGTIEPRKNIAGLVRAFNELQKMATEKKLEEILRHKLVIAGSSGWLSKEIFKEIEKSPAKDKIMVINFVEDADKEYVFNLASLFVYPSLFEGFGFPPLEAMACGVPVVASNNSSLPEIVGQGGIMISPDKPDEIAQAMLAILSDPALKSSLMEKGKAQAAKFNWQKTAEEFLKVVNKL